MSNKIDSFSELFPDHWENKHIHEGFYDDGIVSRLWPFQDITASDSLKFV